MRCVGESWERGVMRGNVIFVDFRGWSVRVLITVQDISSFTIGRLALHSRIVSVVLCTLVAVAHTDVARGSLLELQPTKRIIEPTRNDSG